MATEGSILISSTGRRFCLKKQLAKGGEGAVFLTDDPTLVIKVYHQPEALLEKKLLCMIKHPLEPKADGVHLLIAWPQAVVYENGSFVGYAMPFVKDTHPIYVVARNNERHSNDCHEVFPNYDWRYSLLVAYHLAWTVNYIHQHNYIVGDMNSNNIVIHGDGTITILDVDSFDITDPDTGTRYPCNVGICEFLAPELQGRDLRRANFTKHTDEFALAVHIFILLMGNCHPFTLRPLQPGEARFNNVTTLCTAKQSRSQDQAATNIVEGNCAFIKQVPGYDIPAYAPRISMLPRTIQDGFRWTFGYNKTNFMSQINERATANYWRYQLYVYFQRTKGPKADLIRCRRNPEHYYLASRGTCELCAAKTRYYQFLANGTVSGGGGAAPSPSGSPSSKNTPVYSAKTWEVEHSVNNSTTSDYSTNIQTFRPGNTICCHFRIKNGPVGQKHTFYYVYTAPNGAIGPMQPMASQYGAGEMMNVTISDAAAGKHKIEVYDVNQKLAETTVNVEKKRGWFF